MEIYRSYAALLKCKKSLCPIQKLSSSCQQRQGTQIYIMRSMLDISSILEVTTCGAKKWGNRTLKVSDWMEEILK